MTRALVVVASKYGSTMEIGEVISAALRERGIDATCAGAERRPSIDDYDAVILGGALYAGHWPKAGVEFAKSQNLTGTRVWLFSSGPLGDPPRPLPDDAISQEQLHGLMESTGAIEHRLFAGRLDKSRLNFERAIVAAFRAPEGDFRDWKEIDVWAKGIADTLDAGIGPEA